MTTQPLNMKVELRNRQLKDSLLDKLLDFYLPQQTNHVGNYDDYESAGHIFIETCLQNADVEQKEDFKRGIPFPLREDFFMFDPFASVQEKFYFLQNFENLYIATRNILNDYTPHNIKYSGFKRQASPPMAAYDYIGHNEVHIKPNATGYSKLFR